MRRVLVLPSVLSIWATLSACAAQSAAVPTQTSGPEQPTPPATSTASPTITPAIPEFPQVVHPDESPRQVAAGKYLTPAWFSIPFFFETDQPLGGIGLEDATGELFALVPDKETGIVFFAVDPGISVEEAISMLRDSPTFEVGPSHPVKVAGLDATQFDLLGGGRVPAISAFIGRPVLADTDNWLIQPNQHVRYIVLEVRGRVLVIEVGAPIARFDEYIAEAHKLLSTMAFLDSLE